MALNAPAVSADDSGASAAMKNVLSSASTSDHAYLIGENIVQFVPANFDPALTPSLILLHQPMKAGDMPQSWSVKPVFSASDGLNIATIDIPSDISLYGGGEVQGPLLRNGQTIQLWNSDNYTYKIPDRLYQTHPWVMGVRADGTSFGVIFDTPAKASLSTSSSQIRFGTEGAPFRVLVIERSSPQLVLEALAQLTGTIEMPPRWALGYHQCRFSYYPDSRVKEIADTFRLKQIPCDVIWMDIDYMDGYRIFTFDDERFPDPKGLNDYLHSKGYKAVYMIDPGIKVDEDYSLYRDGRDRDVYVKDAFRNEYHGNVWPGPCAFPDFTRPEVRSWWADLYTPFMANGIDGIWNDMNEPAVMNSPSGTMPQSNIHLGGDCLPTSNHTTYHNAYGRLMVEASRQGIMAANPDKRPFILSRANLLGGQRFAATWTGDNAGNVEHMRLSIPMSITLGLSGQPFNGPDVGGFADNTSAEIFGQWMGFGAFFPFSRGHACNGTNQKEPWVFGKAVEKECRIALQRRYRLIPYYYTLFHRASVNGLPVMQPTFFADITDPALRAEEQSFLIGDDLLVIPSIAETPSLPKGIWRPVSLVKGDTKGKYQAQLLQRGGSIIPLGAAVQHMEEDVLAPLSLMVCLDDKGHAEGRLYWDSGDGWEFKDGVYALVEFVADTTGGRTTVKAVNVEGSYPLDLSDVHIQLLTADPLRPLRAHGDLNKGISLKNK